MFKQDDYDAAFREVDVLITPTTPFAAPKHATNQSPAKRLSAALGLTFNTSPMDATGHPAISIPVGFVSPEDDGCVKLPVGMQIIGPKFGESLLLEVAGSWEKENDWKSIVQATANGASSCPLQGVNNMQV
jgi:amidase